jgi:hypothetical protein
VDREISEAKRDFGDREKIRGKRLRTNSYLGSLTSKTKREFGEIPLWAKKDL